MRSVTPGLRNGSSLVALAAIVIVALTSCAASSSSTGADPHPDARSAGSSFEDGLLGFNLAGVGEVDPEVVSGPARTGTHSLKVELTGEENRSELILGGTGGGSTEGEIRFHDGSEFWYGFSFQIEAMTWGHPGAHNLIMQLFSESYGPNFGLQLWNWEGKKGLWSHGDAMGGDHFLGAAALHEWHDVQIHMRTSNDGRGFYEVFLDGRQVARRTGVSTIHPGDPFAYIKTGLYRNGVTNPGRSEILLDAIKLGKTRESVLPR